MSGPSDPAVPVLAVGYLLAVPVTVFIPGFLRLWRRREPALLAAAVVGSSLVTAGWVLRGSTPPAVVNGVWTVGFTAAYLAEGRTRRRARLT